MYFWQSKVALKHSPSLFYFCGFARVSLSEVKKNVYHWELHEWFKFQTQTYSVLNSTQISKGGTYLYLAHLMQLRLEILVNLLKIFCKIKKR